MYFNTVQCFILLLVKDCGPDATLPCLEKVHTSPSATIYDSPEECCDAHIGWMDRDNCVILSESDGTGTDLYWRDWSSGSCKKDCEPNDDEFGCKRVPPPIALYESIDVCCSNLGTVNPEFCKSRSSGTFTNDFFVDWGSGSRGTCGEINETSSLSQKPMFLLHFTHIGVVYFSLNSQGL